MGEKIEEIFAWIVEEADGGEGIPAGSILIEGEPHFMPMIGADMDRIKALEPLVQQLRHRFPQSPMRLCRFAMVDVVQSLPALNERVVIPPCPVCGETMENMINLEGSHAMNPMDGDLAVCGECATLLIFEANNLRRPDQAEIAALIKDNPGLEEAIGRASADLRAAHDKRDDH